MLDWVLANCVCNHVKRTQVSTMTADYKEVQIRTREDVRRQMEGL
jgi:hypothetical protein